MMEPQVMHYLDSVWPTIDSDTVVVVGAIRDDDDNGDSRGSAYCDVFTLSADGTGAHRIKLLASDGGSG